MWHDWGGGVVGSISKGRQGKEGSREAAEMGWSVGRGVLLEHGQVA